MVFVAWTSFILQKAGFLHSSIVRVRAFFVVAFSSFIFLERTFYIVLRVFIRTGRPFANHKNARPNGIIELWVLMGIPDHNLSRVVVNSTSEEETHTYLYI
jgi:hypothetical protein